VLDEVSIVNVPLMAAVQKAMPDHAGLQHLHHAATEPRLYRHHPRQAAGRARRAQAVAIAVPDSRGRRRWSKLRELLLPAATKRMPV
jgi:hypothetical protein